MAGEFLGEVTSVQAWQGLQEDADAVLLDIRTRAELMFVGRPVLSSIGKSAIDIEWETFPNKDRNPRFFKQFQTKNVRPEQTIYIICRSGRRSRDAALLLAERGYRAYNVSDGFEGDLDADGHRGVGGWCTAQLPWTQREE